MPLITVALVVLTTVTAIMHDLGRRRVPKPARHGLRVQACCYGRFRLLRGDWL